jgi:hypothetical protein
LRTGAGFSTWIATTLHKGACADGITPQAFPLRRLNRNEYTATVRDLLNIPVNAGRNLPIDGAGGEGFDNAAETLFSFADSRGEVFGGGQDCARLRDAGSEVAGGVFDAAAGCAGDTDGAAAAGVPAAR